MPQSSIAAFSCAAGGLPVTSGSTQQSCTTTTATGMTIVHATYTQAIATAGPSQLIDESKLIAAGWVIAGLVNSDGPDFSGTWFLYFHQGAWISWGGTSQQNTFDVWTGTTTDGQPIACGKTLTPDMSISGALHFDVPFPMGTQAAAGFYVAPFCLQDVESFYTTTLSAADWTADGPFQITGTSTDGMATAAAAFTRNGTTVHITLLSTAGNSTEINLQ